MLLTNLFCTIFNKIDLYETRNFDPWLEEGVKQDSSASCMSDGNARPMAIASLYPRRNAGISTICAGPSSKRFGRFIRCDTPINPNSSTDGLFEIQMV